MKTIAFTICTANKRLKQNLRGGEANGYVAVPPEHPLHGKDGDDIDGIDVHGGITLSNYLNVKEYPVEDVEFISEAKEVPSDWWVFGFDTMHFGDSKFNWPKELVKKETLRLQKQLECRTMKRKIVFRGKRKDTGEWVYGDLVRNVEGAFAVVPPFQMDMDNVCSNYEVEPESVGQFTGLHDRNGKEIYEGDILRYIGQGADIVGKIYYREVTFKKGSFCMYCADMDIHSPIISHIMNGVLGWDVVGNIHDTPELLNEK